MGPTMLSRAMLSPRLRMSSEKILTLGPANQGKRKFSDRIELKRMLLADGSLLVYTHKLVENVRIAHSMLSQYRVSSRDFNHMSSVLSLRIQHKHEQTKSCEQCRCAYYIRLWR